MLLTEGLQLDDAELATVLTNQVPGHLNQLRPRQQRGAQNFLTALTIAGLLLLGFFFLTPLLPNNPTSLLSNTALAQTPKVNMSSSEQT